MGVRIRGRSWFSWHACDLRDDTTQQTPHACAGQGNPCPGGADSGLRSDLRHPDLELVEGGNRGPGQRAEPRVLRPGRTEGEDAPPPEEGGATQSSEALRRARAGGGGASALVDAPAAAGTAVKARPSWATRSSAKLVHLEVLDCLGTLSAKSTPGGSRTRGESHGGSPPQLGQAGPPRSIGFEPPRPARHPPRGPGGEASAVGRPRGWRLGGPPMATSCRQGPPPRR
jgi:hypothetical protein